jgi:polyhydroxybutyrate depolymerase
MCAAEPMKAALLSLAIAALVGLVLHQKPNASTETTGESRSLSVDGVPRTYRQVVPFECGRPSDNCPLVLGFHGGGIPGVSGNQFAQQTGMVEAAIRLGVILILPNAHGNNWNDGRPGTGATADDVKFVRDILNNIGREGIRYDPQRVMATGISNGGHMSFRLACEMGDVFTAIAPVAANLEQKLAKTCKPSRPISVLNIVGIDDRISPYGGGDIKSFSGKVRGTVVSSDATLAFWMSANQCNPSPTKNALDQAQDDGTSVLITRYSRCLDNAIVERRAIVGGGHTWPGHPDKALIAVLTGRSSREFDATEVILTFLKSALSQ